PLSPPTDIYALSLHDALPISRILINGCLDRRKARARRDRWFVSSIDATPADEARVSAASAAPGANPEARLLARERRSRLAAAIRSEEHTSELQSRSDLVCRLL